MRVLSSLHVRLTLVLSAIVATLTAGLLWAGSWSAERYGAEVRQLLNRDVAAHLVEHVQPFAGEALDPAALKSIFMDVMVVNPSLEVYLLDKDGGILAYDAPPERIVRQRVDLAPVQSFLDGKGPRLIEGDDPRDRTGRKPFSVAPVLEGGELRGYLYMIVGGQEFDSVAALLRGSFVARVFLFAALGLALLTGLVGMFVFARLTRPLRQLRTDMAGFREPRPHVPVPVEGSDEIAELSRAYEWLVARVSECVRGLEDGDRERREFVADVSHDLRTPLASLDGYLELLRERPNLSPEQRREYIEAASRGARQLVRLVDQLFQLARLESGDVPVAQDLFCPGELAQDVLQSHRIEAAKHGVRLVGRLSRQLPQVRADIGLIERALDNLLSNAMRYTPRGGRVELSVLRRAGRVEFSVRDTGPGVAIADLPQVLDRRFHRDAKGTQDGVSTGLGLAITRRIVEIHGGEIEVLSTEGCGATFRFALPSAEA